MSATAKSILVVEDDADIRDSIVELLRDEGYEASACANGQEALERLRKASHTDAILLDLMMPVMDGWQFRVQQKRDPRLASIPVLALSADPSAKAAAIDADAYLPKPFNAATLMGSLERTLLAVERRELQATLVETERLASLGTLAAGVAHEINNPLAYVMANLGFIEQALGAPRAPGVDVTPVTGEATLREALAEARDGCERIRRIVRDLQLFSRTSEGEECGVDVRSVLDSSANIVTNEIRSRAQLTKDYGDVPTISVNPSRLGQVFLNLIVNATQAIRAGDAAHNEIRLSAHVEDGAIVVRVSDTGEGIPADVRPKIFDPFFTTKPLGVGTGLGLSISKRLVTAMRGELAVEDRRGDGTTFRVRLPLGEGNLVTVRPGRSMGPPSSPPRRREPGPPRILVVDDEPLMGPMVRRILSGGQYRVEVTTDPEAAIARIARGERFDLILCDMTMPGRSGIEVEREIAALAQEQARRMLFLTGGALNPIAAEFLACRAGTVIGKPFSLEELREGVDAALARFEASEASKASKASKASEE